MNKSLLCLIFLIFHGGSGLECEEPLKRDYCVVKGQNGKELPTSQVPLEVKVDIGVTVKDY